MRREWRGERQGIWQQERGLSLLQQVLDCIFCTEEGRRLFFGLDLLAPLAEDTEEILSPLGTILGRSGFRKKGVSSCHLFTSWVIILHALEI